MGKEIIKLTSLRLSFPQLFRAKAFNKDQEPAFSACFILNKESDAKQIQAIREAMTHVANEKWGTKVPKGVKLCLRAGDEEGKEGVDGYGPDVMFVSASSRKKVPVVGRDLTPLSEEDGKPYAGCYVNVSLRLWAQDNEYGKRINAQLRAVQFVKDGEAFGEAPVDVEEEFEAMEGDESSGGEGGGLLG